MGCSGHCSCQLVQLKPGWHMPGGGQGLFTGPAQEGPFPWGREQESGELGPAWQTQEVGHDLFSPMGGAGRGEYAVRPNYPSFHLSPQTSCALTTPIALSTPRRSASQWRCCSRMRACRNTTKSSPLCRQLPHLPKILTLCFLSLYFSPHLSPKVAQ